MFCTAGKGIEIVTGVNREVDQVLHHLGHLVALLPRARLQTLLPPGGLIWTEGELSSVAPISMILSHGNLSGKYMYLCEVQYSNVLNFNLLCPLVA